MRTGVLCGTLAVVSACAGTNPGTPVEPASAAATRAAVPGPTPENPVMRVGGDVDLRTRVTQTKSGAVYTFGSMRIDTPLPVGYPAPTPPGAIELKYYPSVRRAEVVGRAGVSPEQGRNDSFWPLFRHIESRQIAMTAPVEMNYHDQTPAPGDSTPVRATDDSLSVGGAVAPASQGGSEGEWTMAFLYRSPDNGDTEQDGRVSVLDAPAVTVLSIGQRGSYSASNRRKGIEQLRAWLVEHPEWQQAGDIRSLYYHDPFTLPWNKWSETQMPVKPAQP